MTLRDVIIMLRKAYAGEVQRRESIILHHDIQHLLGRHDEDFDQGWPKHFVNPAALYKN